MFLKKIGIDLGTTNVLVYIPGKGIVINEPSVVALDAATSKIVAIGKDAKIMIGRTPESIIASHPLKDGVIANYKVTQAMLNFYINKLSNRIKFVRPDVMVAIPAGVTSTEKRAVIDATIAAGAKNAYVIKSPIAAAIGAGIPISTPEGHMIIDIGGGTSEVAVIALGDIVASTSVRIGGQKMDEAIINYVRKKYNLVIGEQTAEIIKINIGAIMNLKKELQMEISGCNAITGLPESIIVSSGDVVLALHDVINEIIAAVKSVLQKTPPELASDVMDKGIVMAGGGSMLRNIDQLFSKVTGVPCEIAEDPLSVVAKGTGIAIENLDAYKRSVLWSK